jgi:hypothetical protein
MARLVRPDKKASNLDHLCWQCTFRNLFEPEAENKNGRPLSIFINREPYLINLRAHDIEMRAMFLLRIGL